MKRYLSIFFALVLSSASAFAQKTPAAIQAEINTLITTNGAGAITGAILNGVLQDLAVSYGSAQFSVANNTALKALPVSVYTSVARLGYASAGDGGFAVYNYSSSACSLNAGAGDNGAQIQPTTGTGCWLLDTSLAAPNVQVWGAKKEAAGGYVATPVDPAGTFDSTAAFNAAAASGITPIIIPAGRFHVTNKITCGANGQAFWGAGLGQSIIDVGSDFILTATAVFDPAPTSTETQIGCELHNIGFEFYQNPANTLLSQLIQYPWAINPTTPASRIVLDNIRIARAWNGIAFIGNFAPIWNGIIQIGAWNTPFDIDGPLDYTFINDVEIWPFGAEGSPNLSAIFKSNVPISILGYVDGLEVNSMAFFQAGLTLNSSAQYVTGNQIANLHFNGTAGGLIVNAGGIQIGNLSLDVNGPALTVQGPYDSTYVLVNNCKCITNSTTGYIANHGGFLQINGGTLSLAASATMIVADTAYGASSTTIANMDVHPSTTIAIANSVITQGATGNAFINLHNIHVNYTPVTPVAPFITINNDLAGNAIRNVDFPSSGWSVSNPAVAITLNVAGVKGFYDLPTVPYAITSYPKFATMGDFSTTSNTVAGNYYLRGNRVDFYLTDTFTTNAYTTASGAFTLLTNMPYGTNNFGQAPLSIGNVSNVTWAAKQFNAQATATNPIAINFPLLSSGGAWSNMGPTNIPASTSNILFTIAGSYPIK